MSRPSSITSASHYAAGSADPAPGPEVALVRDGYVSVTPLMSIVRG